MAKLGIAAAFASYGATLKNQQWSVSAWLPDGSLVVSLWDHHYCKSAPGTMEFADSLNRWSSHGNAEFRRNVAQAFATKAKVRLVIVKTTETHRVQAGEDASEIKNKEFFIRDDLVGEVAELNGDNYVFRFRRA